MKESGLRKYLRKLENTLSSSSRKHSLGSVPKRQIDILRFLTRSPNLATDMRIPICTLIDCVCQDEADELDAEKFEITEKRVNALRELLRQLNKNIRDNGCKDVVFVFDDTEIRFLANTTLAKSVSMEMARGLRLAKMELHKRSTETKRKNKPVHSRISSQEKITGETTDSTSDAQNSKEARAQRLESRHAPGVTYAQMYSGMEDSPFCLESLLPKARKDVILVGPNLWWAATHSKDIIFSWLNLKSTKKKKEPREFRILLSDPEHNCGREYLGRFDNYFSAHLDKAVEELAKWVREARKDGIRLHVRTSRIVSMGILAIDARTPQGKIVLTPILRGESVSGKRPHILISKRDNPTIFLSYWTCIDTLWKESENFQLHFKSR